MASHLLVGKGCLIVQASLSSSDIPLSVAILWTSDQPNAETSNWHHTTLTTNRHSCPSGSRSLNLSRRTATDQLLRPRGHWNLLRSK